MAHGGDEVAVPIAEVVPLWKGCAKKKLARDGQRRKDVRAGRERDVVHIKPLALHSVAAEDCSHLDEVLRGLVGRE